MKNKFIYEKYDPNFFYIDIELHYNCNYNCSYCYQKQENILNTKNKKSFNYKIIQNFLLKNQDKKLELNIQGGEPLLFKSKKEENEFYNFLLFLDEYQNKNNAKICIISNCSNTRFLDKIKNLNIQISYSIHPEFDNLYTILNKLKILKQFKIKNIGMLLLYDKFPSTLYLEIYNKILENNLDYFPGFIYNNHYLNESYKIFLNTLNDKLLYPTKTYAFYINNKRYNLNDIIFNKNNIFENCTCYNNFFVIDPELNLINPCSNNKIPLFPKIPKLNIHKIQCKKNLINFEIQLPFLKNKKILK